MNETLVQGLAVMLVGLGTVLTFLCITIASMFVMAKVVGKLNEIFPELVPQTAGASANAASNDEEGIAVAILSALLKK